MVHKSRRMTYVNKKDIEKHKKARLDIPTLSVKMIGRLTTGTYDNKADYLFCGNKIVISTKSPDDEAYSCVRTFNFVEKTITVCKERNDEWALTVHGRIEYFSGDLHAADCLYRHACDVNFRTGRGIPQSPYKALFYAKKGWSSRKITTKNKHFRGCANTLK